jgi:uroporphyrinogen decarboxylase
VKSMMYARPELLHRILATNAKAVAEYLNAQIGGGRAGRDDLRYLGRQPRARCVSPRSRLPIHAR